MYQRFASSPKELSTCSTAELREKFLIESLFEPGQINMVYSHYDRLIIGGAMPGTEPIALGCPDTLKADYFLERRELGILNVGGTGRVVVDGQEFLIGPTDCLYVGRGARTVLFEGGDSRRPAKFYLLSAPAHRAYATARLTQAEAIKVELGAQSTANRRTIYKYIYPEGIPSCQLVMGMTQLHVGNVWNTMPAHTHDRRTEVYLYFNLPPNQRVLHLLGEPHETRLLWVDNEQAVLSPPWSIHAGCGTNAYAFVWGMAGENREYTDMDPVELQELA